MAGKGEDTVMGAVHRSWGLAVVVRRDEGSLITTAKLKGFVNVGNAQQVVPISC
jgi:hypothetical protein